MTTYQYNLTCQFLKKKSIHLYKNNASAKQYHHINSTPYCNGHTLFDCKPNGPHNSI
jgi:hypothetical protein